MATLGSPWGKRDWIDAADHLIFNGHHLFDLNLAKKMFIGCGGEGGEGGKKHHGFS